MPILESFGVGPTLLLALVVALAGLVHGTLGLGFPLVSTPLLALLTDVRSAILITLVPTMAVNVVSIGRGGGWQRTFRAYWPMIALVPIGSVFGSWLLVTFDPAPFKLLLAALILAYLNLDRFAAGRMQWVKRHRLLAFTLFGLGSGLLAGTVNVMVPLLIVYCLECELSQATTVQLLNSCFLTGKLSQAVALAALGSFQWDALVLTAPLALLAVGALLLGMRLRARIKAATYRRWLRWVLALMAALLALQFVAGWS